MCGTASAGFAAKARRGSGVPKSGKPSPAELEAYVVYVGFDDFGDRGERRPPAAQKAAPRAK